MTDKQKQFNRIINKYRDRIYNQALFFTANRADAADISQEVLIKLWLNYSEIKQSTLTSWLIAVTRNLCIDYSRKKKEIQFASKKGSDGGLPIYSDRPDTAANPEESAINNDLKKRIQDALQEIPEVFRNILILREIQQHRYRDIARAMDLPMSSIKVYLHRARKQLREKLLLKVDNTETSVNRRKTQHQILVENPLIRAGR